MPAWGLQPHQIGSLALNLGGGDLPLNIVPPSISINGNGVAASGNIATVDPGTWTKGPSTIAYAWYRSGSLVAGQTGASYAITSADIGFNLTAEVRFTNANGVASKRSPSTATIVVQAPTFSPAFKSNGATLSNGNRTCTTSGSAGAYVNAGANGGAKWAVGFRLDANGGQATFGVRRAPPDTSFIQYQNTTSATVVYDNNAGYLYNGGAQQGSAISTLAIGSVVTFAYNSLNGNAEFYVGSNLVFTFNIQGGVAYPGYSDFGGGVTTLVLPYLPAGYEVWPSQ